MSDPADPGERPQRPIAERDRARLCAGGPVHRRLRVAVSRRPAITTTTDTNTSATTLLSREPTPDDSAEDGAPPPLDRPLPHPADAR